MTDIHATKTLMIIPATLAPRDFPLTAPTIPLIKAISAKIIAIQFKIPKNGISPISAKTSARIEKTMLPIISSVNIVVLISFPVTNQF